jgi:pectinesterase inhibitor-like protein
MWAFMGKLALAVVVGAFFIVPGVHATPQTTCRAAANIDKRVNYDFCVSELIGHPESPNADAWGLAKIIASLGEGNASGAVADIEDLLAKPGTDDKLKVPLEKCHKLYYDMGLAFADATDEINWRHYDIGKKKAARAIPLAQQCDNAFVKVGVRSPLTKRSEDSVQLVIICIAITNLIK